MLKKYIVLIVLLSCSGALFADLRDAGDLYVRAGNVFMDKSNTMASGPERNSLFQKARVLFERAIELYNLHLEQNPQDAGQLTPLITELNSRIFWCNKSTTSVYNKSATPSADEAFKESGLDLSLIEDAKKGGGGAVTVMLEDLMGEPEPLSPEEAKRLADKKKTADFLAYIADLIKRRRTVEAKFLCRRAIRKPEMGIPRPLARQILNELDFVERFIGSVYMKADKLIGTRLRAETLVNREGAINGIIKKIDKGVVHIDIATDGVNVSDQLSIGVPLLSFSDSFLVRNTESRGKDVMAGIGSFFLLMGDSGRARKVFTSIAAKPGDPADMKPFIARTDTVVEMNKFRETEQQTAGMEATLEKETESALDYYERKKFDNGLRSIGRILEASQGKIENLLPVSKRIHEKTEKYLPEFAEALLNGCTVCKGAHKMKCPKCGGRGWIKVSMARKRRCTQCGGDGEAECTACRSRRNSKRFKGYIEELRKIFKRDEQITEDPEGKKEKIVKPAEGTGTGPEGVLKEGAVTAGGFKFKMKDGTLTITGYVANGTTFNVKNVAVNITLKDEKGNAVHTAATLVEKVLAPNAIEAMTMVIEKAPAYMGYSYSLAFEKAPAQ